jgi:hypothetical protein
MYIPLAATVATVFIGSANARTFQYDGYTVNPSDNVNITGPVVADNVDEGSLTACLAGHSAGSGAAECRHTTDGG